MIMASPDVFLGPTPEFPALMTRQLTAMRDNGTLTDFTITAADKETKLPCHKVILAIHSPYLTAMFTTDMVEAASNTVHYDDIELNTMKLILEYCYSEQIGFSSDQFMSLIEASDYLQIKRLKERCVNEVKNFLTPENVLQYLSFAGEQNLKEIKSWCMKIIVNSFSEVASQPAILTLAYTILQECVKEVVRSDVQRDDVLYTVFKWVNENAETRGEHLKELLLHVQLDNCSLPAILDVMMTHEALIAKVGMLDQLTNSVRKHTEFIKESTDPTDAKAFLNPENVLQYLTFAGKHNLQDIKTWCLEVITNSFPDVSKQPAFLDLNFAELQDCMSEVAQRYMERDEVLRAVFEWVNNKAESRSIHLEELLQKVQLDNCSVHAIHDVMETHMSLIASNFKVMSLLIKAVKKQTAQMKSTTLVIAGGLHDKKPNTTFWSLDTKTKDTQSFIVPFDNLAGCDIACETPQGFALTGEEIRGTCVMFVTSTMSWQKMPSMKRKRGEHGSIYNKGVLYVMCGKISGKASAFIDCLTLAGGEWESLPDCPIVALWPILAELNDKIYMLDQQTTDQLHVFDPQKKEWGKRASLPSATSKHVSMIAVNGQLCVAGGHQGICAWYNPATNVWTMSEQRPSKKHHYGSLVQVDTTTLLLLGGSWNDGTDEIEELNIEDGSWSVKELRMPAKLYCHKAFLLDMPQQTTASTGEED